MSSVFYFSDRTDFSGIEDWNTSRVENMSSMFELALNFNADISSFYEAIDFNQDISKWDVSKAEDMQLMFCGARSFNQNLKGWKLHSNVRRTDMFLECPIEKKFKPIKSREKATAR